MNKILSCKDGWCACADLLMDFWLRMAAAIYYSEMYVWYIWCQCQRKLSGYVFLKWLHLLRIGRLNESSAAGHSSCLITKLRDKSPAPVMLKELFPQTYLHGTAHSVALEQPYKVVGWVVPRKYVCGKSNWRPCFHHRVLWWGTSYYHWSSCLIFQ
jgi:hypothetical protein